MATDTPTTHQKALTLNLDDKIYGAIAEIGAAQEVARWFFRVGAAAGSIAKTMSAYDKQISDDIYGETGRYVSRQRLESMLDREYSLLIDRLAESRGDDTRFFAFCNTVSTRNFAGTNECQGWVGMRYQSSPGGEPNTIILHINMLDDSAVAQQEVIGVLGVNLIYGAFFQADGSGHGLASLADNTGCGRLEADLADASGPVFAGIDSIATGLTIVRIGLAQAVLFDHEGRQQPPTEILHKRPAIIERTSLRSHNGATSEGLRLGAAKLLAQDPSLQVQPLKIKEFSTHSVHATSDDDASTLAHVRKLVNDNDWVMVTNMSQSFRISSYIRRYSQQPVRYIVGLSNLVMQFCERFYSDSGGLLEATGKLYSDNVRTYVQAMHREDIEAHVKSAGLDDDWFELSSGQDPLSLASLQFHGALHHLFDYLLDSDCIQELSDDS